MIPTLGYVSLIGAGCGPSDLITLRGMSRLQACDAVVYDDLIDPALLTLAPVSAERIYMGKRSGRHSAPQEEINAKLVSLARDGKRVARLKGGDPFVFGRGGEEILALQAAGIPYEEIPGISSAIAIPAAAGIPVTHRGTSQSLHIVTGHTADTSDALPANFDHLAALDGTLVFLMGLKQLSKITEQLLSAGKSPATPAAVISGGNSLHPAAVRGTLSNISILAADVQPPAVIVVGAVAALDLCPAVTQPLNGIYVGVTGTEAVTERLSRSLTELGACTVPVERSALVELPLSFDPNQLGDGQTRWLVFTSSNGVQLFFRRLKEHRIDLRSLRSCKFAVIGEATGRTLAQYGIYADLCPSEYTSRQLGYALREAAAPEEEIILLRSIKGSVVLPTLLKERGLVVRDVPIYDLHALPEEMPWEAEILSRLNYLVFSSASGVDFFFQRYDALPPQVVCVCIGSVTAEALLRYGYSSFLTAKENSVQGIVEAILLHRQGN